MTRLDPLEALKIAARAGPDREEEALKISVRLVTTMSKDGKITVSGVIGTKAISFNFVDPPDDPDQTLLERMRSLRIAELNRKIINCCRDVVLLMEAHRDRI